MIPRKSTEARPRNQNQSLVANAEAAARPVPPLRLQGSAADKDKSAAAPIAASAKPKEAAAPKPKEPVPKPKVAAASSSKRKHHNKARPQRAASQGGAKLAASHTAASNASKCADMWRTSTAPTPAQRSKSTSGGPVHAPLAAPLPAGTGSSLADFKWAWKRDGNAAAAALTAGAAGTARSGAAGTGRVDAAARMRAQQKQQQQPKGGGRNGGWGQEVKPLSQVLQEQWHHAETAGTARGEDVAADEDVAVRRRRRPLVAQPPSPRAVAEAAAMVLQKGWQASAEARAPAPQPTLAPPTTAAFAAARRVTDAPLPPWAVTQAGLEAAEAAAARAVAAAAAAAVAEAVAAGAAEEEEDHRNQARRSSAGGDSPAAHRPPSGPKLRTASGYSRAAKEDPLPDGWQPATRSGEEVFIHVSGLTLRTRRAVEMYEKMQAKSGGTDRGSAMDRGTDARAAYAARGASLVEASPDSRENSPRGGGSPPLASPPRSPTGGATAVGLSSPDRIRRQRHRSEAAQIALFEAMAPGGGGEPGRARAQSAGNLPLFNKEHQARMCVCM